MFACKYEKEQTLPERPIDGSTRMLAEQFGRGTVQFWNSQSERSELQVYFWSDTMANWSKQFIRPHENDPFWLSFDITQRPFKHSKTNMKSLLIVSSYFRHARVFVPVFFALLDDDQTQQGLEKALIKFRSEILETMAVIP